MTRSSLAAAAALAVALSGQAALAGEQYVDETGYAVSGYDVVAYHALEQSPIGEAQPRAVRGLERYTVDWNGATWAFASAENRDAFLAEPEAYAPAYDGHCAYGVGKGGKVPGNPNLCRIVDGTLYLNINPAVVSFWESDLPGWIEKADANWSGLEDDPASDRRWTAIDANRPTYEAVGPLTN